MENGINTVAVFGDSILKGIVSGTGSGRMYDILAENALSLASQKLGFTLKNYSAFGNIMTKTKKSLDYRFANGLEADVIIIEGGGNDCNVNWAEIKQHPLQPQTEQVPLKDYTEIIESLADEIRDHRITPVLVSPQDFVIDRWFSQLCINGEKEKILSYYAGDIANLAKKNQEYADAMVRTAEKKHVQYIDTRSAIFGRSDSSSFMCPDGIHPNAQGHLLMEAVFESRLPELKKEF